MPGSRGEGSERGTRKQMRGGRRRTELNRWLDNIPDSVGVNLDKLWEMAEDRGAWSATVHGVAKNQTQLSV